MTFWKIHLIIILYLLLISYYIPEEHIHEWNSTSGMYPRMAKEAREEGFTDIAALFDMVTEIERTHEERFLALLKNLENKEVFQKSEATVWECRNCGHQFEGTNAPLMCPVCKHPQSYFEVKKINY